jgi:hypothetical protein
MLDALPAIRDRVKDFRRVKASELRANAKNWRRHPEGQRSALSAMLQDVGLVDALMVREMPDGKLYLIDGHLRADIAGDTDVPVLVVDLTDEETAKVLATFDPLGGLAVTDSAALTALLDGACFISLIFCCQTCGSAPIARFAAYRCNTE